MELNEAKIELYRALVNTTTLTPSELMLMNLLSEDKTVRARSLNRRTTPEANPHEPPTDPSIKPSTDALG